MPFRAFNPRSWVIGVRSQVSGLRSADPRAVADEHRWPDTQHPKTYDLCFTIRPCPFCVTLRVTLEMIKWEHSIFALPFALCGAMLAADGFPSIRQLLWIVVAMVAARSAAMAFNRWADAAIDAANPRTSTRALPAGHLSPAFVVTFVVVSSLVFVLAASQLNRLALAAFTGCTRCVAALFLYQAGDALVPPGAGFCARYRALGGVDRGARIA